MQTIRQLVFTFLLAGTFSIAGAQTCQPPAVSQLFANNITLNSARLNCNTISGASLYQFQYRQVGTSYCTPTTSSSQNYSQISGLTSNTSYQFQCRVYCTNGWTAYSSSQTFSTSSGGNSCSNPFEFSCGTSYNGSNNTGNYNYSSYPFNGAVNMTGPEAYHRLTINYPILLTLNMQPQTADLDIYLMSTCGNTSGLAVSQNSNTNSEQIVISLNPGVYYVIIDGYNGAVSNYSMSASCTQSPACPAPAYGDLYTDNLTCSSVRLNCDNGGANAWDWAYRLLNTVDWIDLPSTSTPSYTLTGLQASKTYEYICTRRCSNYSWSDWSPIRQFTTPNCGPNGNSCNNPVIAYCGYTYTGNNNTGSKNFSTYKYNGQTITNESGPEMIYQITMGTAGPLSISLGGLSGDLDLFLLSNCNNNAVLALSGNSGSLGEVINIGNLAAGTYQIVIDGWNNTTSNYTLSITGNCTNNNSNDEPCYAATITPYTNCFTTNATNVGASLTTNPGMPEGCYSSVAKDVWFKLQMPLSGKILFSTFPGSLSDAVIAVYAGAYCTGLVNYGGCFDDTNGDHMPDIQIQAAPGSTIYLRIWGFNGFTGTFTVCATTLNSFQVGIPIVTVNNLADSGDRAMAQEGDVTKKSEGLTMLLYPVPAVDELLVQAGIQEEGEVLVQIINLSGQVIRAISHDKQPAGIFETTIDIDDLPSGVFLLRVKSGGHEIINKFIKS